VSERITIEGVRVIDLDAHVDDRGSLAEVYRASWMPAVRPIVQANLSRSRAGVLRGMHFHRRQTDHWVIESGSAWVGLYDLRAGSPTEKTGQTIQVDAAAGLVVIVIPPGVAHGFCALTDLTLLYLVDVEFDGGDEFGFAWNDPALGVEWPLAAPVVSDRDAAAPSLTAALADPPRFTPG
jgi:dTDP-4-dehydrorhamnose 3,5-epimerase